MSGVLRAPRPPCGRANSPAPRIAAQFLVISFMAVWGVTAFRRLAGIRRQRHPLVFIFPRCPSFYRAVPVFGKRGVIMPIIRLRHRSTANTATLLHLLWRIRALAFAIGAVTRIFMLAAHFSARCGRRGHLPFATNASGRCRRFYLATCGGWAVEYLTILFFRCADGLLFAN